MQSTRRCQFSSQNNKITLQVDVNTMTNAQCKNTNWSPSAITDNMICATDIGKSSCAGDSGGPLVANEGSHNSVIGKKAIII